MEKSTRNQIKAEFFEFLRENNCASEFCVNFYSKKGKNYRHVWEDTINKYLNTKNPKYLVLKAYPWYKTIQGHVYWVKMQCAWEKRMYAIKYNIQMSKDETNSH